MKLESFFISSTNTPPRPLEEIDAELKILESEIANLLRAVAS